MQRLKPDERRVQILSAALELARTAGYSNVTREDVAKEAGVSDALVTFYFNNMYSLRTAIIREAIETKDLKIIVQGLSHGHPAAVSAPPTLKSKALKSLMR